MLLKEIEQSVNNWMDSKADELKQQQKVLEEKTQEQVEKIQAEHQRQTDAERDAFQKYREEIDRRNDERVQKIQAIQQEMNGAADAVKKTKEDLSQTFQEQARIRDEQKKNLKEQTEQLQQQKSEFSHQMKETREEIDRSLKKKVDLSRVQAFEEELEEVRNSQGASRMLPVLLSSVALALVVAMIVLTQLGIFPFGKKTAEQVPAEESTPIPTVIVTEKPTPEPTPTPAPTPEPVEEDLLKMFPTAPEMKPSDVMLAVEGNPDYENCTFVRSYQIAEDRYLNIFELDLTAEEPTPEPAAEPDQQTEAKEGTSESSETADLTETTEEPEATQEVTEEPTPEPAADPNVVPNEENPDAQQEEEETAATPEGPTVLKTVESDAFRYVFFAETGMTEEESAAAVKEINVLFFGESAEQEPKGEDAAAVADLLTAIQSTEGFSEDCLMEAEKIPEELKEKTAELADDSAVWMGNEEDDAYVLAMDISSWNPEDLDANVQKLTESGNTDFYSAAGYLNSGKNVLAIVYSADNGSEPAEWINSIISGLELARIGE